MDQQATHESPPITLDPFSLLIHVKEGILYRNTETFGSMDPFVVFEHKKKKVKTRVIDEAGMRPVWNQSVEITGIHAMDESVKVACFDEDIIMDDSVGTEEFTVQ